MHPFRFTIGFSIALAVLAVVALGFAGGWWALEAREDQLWTEITTGTPGTDAYKKANAEIADLKSPETVTFYGAAIAGGLAGLSLIAVVVSGIMEGIKA
jgi:hypothetical protein